MHNKRTQMGTSNCNQNLIFSSGLSSSRVPSFSVNMYTLNANKVMIFGVKSRVCGTLYAVGKGGSVGGGVLGKELEFKPAFDEYLKAMESAKVVRERNKEKKKAKASRVVKGKDVEFNDFESDLDEKDGKLNNVGEKNGTLRDFVDGENVDKDGFFRTRSKGFVSKFGGGDDKGGFDRTRRGGRGLFRREEGGGTVRGIESNERFGDKGGIQGRNINSDKVARRNDRLLRNRNATMDTGDDSEDVGRAPFNKFEDCGIVEKPRVGKMEMDGRVDNDVKIWDRRVRGDGVVQRNGRLLGNRNAMMQMNIDTEDIERAAFKKFEDSDIMNQPRVGKMEMEDRTQRLAKALNGADINMPEWMFSRMMRSARIRFNDHSIIRVIQVLGKYGNWKRVLQVIEWLQMRERYKSHKLRYIYTAALDVLKKAGRPVEALNLFYAMKKQISSYPDIVAYRCIAVTLGQAGYMKELFDVIDSMRSPPKKKIKTGLLDNWDPRLEPDIIVYNAVLNACVQRKQLDGAFWVLQQIKQQGLQPSAATYGLVMEVMFACGKYDLVHEYFRKVRKSSIPNAVTYKVLVNTFWKEGKTDEALLAVQDMERRGIVGSAAIYYDLARCLCSAGRCQEALMQIEKICKVANKPLVVTYTGLIQACVDSGNIQDADFIFSQINKFCSANLVTCNIMIRAYLDHGMLEEAKSLLQKMLEDGNRAANKFDNRAYVNPDSYTFNIMLEACTANQRWEEFGSIYLMMLHHNLNFNPKRHLKMVLDASRAGKGELVETTWKYLVEADQIPPPGLVKERFCIQLEKGDCAAALSSIKIHPAGDSHAFSKRAWLNLLKENASRFQNDSLGQLIYEIGCVIAQSDKPNQVFVDLLTSCREFFTTRTVVEKNEQPLCLGQT